MAETIYCRRVLFDYIKQLIISAIMLVEDFYQSSNQQASVLAAFSLIKLASCSKK